jgi:flavin reductase (DIM6/NTAB) family NADH-FMN oxidoreductase RutF
MSIEPMAMRQIMSRFATGVTLLTTRSGDRVWGMTANAVLSLSLDPPLILVAVDRRNQMHRLLTDGRCFSLTMLTAEQEELSRRFATPGPKDFGALNLTSAVTGAPILADGLAFVDCRLLHVIPGGDHDIFIGEAVAGAAHDGEPLIFYSGRYARLAPGRRATDWLAGYESLEATIELYGCL